MIAAVVAIGPLITRRLRTKTNLLLVGGYLTLLVVLSVICIFIPASALVANIDPALTTDNIPSDQSIAAEINTGSFDAPEGFTKTETSFDTASDRIRITGSGDLLGGVYVGTKGVDVRDNGTNKIDVYSYVSGDVRFNGTCYPVQIDAPEVILDQTNHLFINPAAKKLVDLYQFDDLFTVQRFSGTDYSSSSGSSSSCLVVIVLLPPGVTAELSGTLPLSSLLQPVS